MAVQLLLPPAARSRPSALHALIRPYPTHPLNLNTDVRILIPKLESRARVSYREQTKRETDEEAFLLNRQLATEDVIWVLRSNPAVKICRVVLKCGCVGGIAECKPVPNDSRNRETQSRKLFLSLSFFPCQPSCSNCHSELSAFVKSVFNLHYTIRPTSKTALGSLFCKSILSVCVCVLSRKVMYGLAVTGWNRSCASHPRREGVQPCPRRAGS